MEFNKRSAKPTILRPELLFQFLACVRVRVHTPTSIHTLTYDTHEKLLPVYSKPQSAFMFKQTIVCLIEAYFSIRLD